MSPSKTCDKGHNYKKLNAAEIVFISENLKPQIQSTLAKCDFSELCSNGIDTEVKLKECTVIFESLSHIASKKAGIGRMEELVLFIKNLWNGCWSIPTRREFNIWLLGGLCIHTKKIAQEYNQLRINYVKVAIEKFKERIALFEGLKAKNDLDLMKWQEEKSWYKGIYGIPFQCNPLTGGGRDFFKTAEEVRMFLTEKMDIFHAKVNKLDEQRKIFLNIK